MHGLGGLAGVVTLYDKGGHPVDVAVQDSRNCLAARDEDGRMILDVMLSEFQALNTKVSGDPLAKTFTRSGPAVMTDGKLREPRGCRDSDAARSRIHGKYHEAVMRGNVRVASMQIPSAIVGLAPESLAPITLWNPPGSKVNLELLNVNGAFYAQVGFPARGACIVLADFLANEPATLSGPFTVLAIRNALLTTISTTADNTIASAVRVFESGTLGAGLYPGVVGTLLSLAGTVSAPSTTMVAVNADIAGRYVVVPGTAVTVRMLAGGLDPWIVGNVGFIWEEVPIY